ncbi:transmembrane protein 209 isoform X2 [Bicyclus anynana]|nr:transmembrane protein 209 isoform X2 [Bicyclus anynana]
MHYVELGCACVLAANLLQYAVRLTPSRAPRLALSPTQQKLLGLSNTELDSSFILAEPSSGHVSKDNNDSSNDDGLMLWPRYAAPSTPQTTPPRTSAPSSPLAARSSPRTGHSSSFGGHSSSFAAQSSPFASHSSPFAASSSPYAASSSPSAGRSSPLAAHSSPLIHDEEALAQYLERCAASGGGPPPVYQLAAVESGGGKLEESSPPGSPSAWWRLDLDPQRLTQWNLNLRLWIHLTILERLTRELRSTDESLARLALCEAGALRGGRVPTARLRALAAHVPALSALVPFLEPFADQRYLLKRIGELAQGGCLSAYRWSSGGEGWDAARPTDAELLMHLVAAYLDGQLPGGATVRPFSDEYLVEGAATSGRRLAIARLAARPPHYALVWRGASLHVARGRNNLLHTLLLFLAAAAREEPPALARTHLGRAGLNMLWIIGR